MHAIPRNRWLFILITLALLTLPVVASAQVAISVSFGPPALPIYAQPICPAPNYIWVPGYWAYDPNFGDYFWVPGTWVLAPEPGYLWTPPYWAWDNDDYYFHPGYWAPEVGYYGGIDYGYGYYGHGYEGGRWNHGEFYYNRAVNNINVTNIRNVYDVRVNEPRTISRVSYNGGPGGIEARPTPAEEAASRERHVEPVAAQTRHVQEARRNPELRATSNHGKPPVAATPKPTTFKGAGVVAAREAGAPYHPPEKRPAETNVKQPPPRPGTETAARPENQPNRGTNTAARAENPPARATNEPAPRPEYNPRTPMHARDVTPHTAPPPPNNANAAQQREAQQREQQIKAEDEQHQRLAQQQAEEHQRMSQQNATDRQMQEMEQRHAQQTQQMEQRHTQAQPPRQQPAPHAESRPAPGAKPSPDRH